MGCLQSKSDIEKRYNYLLEKYDNGTINGSELDELLKTSNAILKHGIITIEPQQS